MNFDFSDDQKQLRDEARKFLSEQRVSDAMVGTFIAQEDPSSRDKNLAGVQNFAANLRAFSDKGIKTRYSADMPALRMVDFTTIVV